MEHGEKIGVPAKYAPPTLVVLGSVRELTLVQDKKLGESDGFSFQGVSITNASS